MGTPPAPSAAQSPEPGLGESPRAQLARLALDAALALDGVAGAEAGPARVWTTPTGGERLDGVVATAVPGGRYGVALHLVCELVPLHPLADRIRERLARSVSAAGLEGALGPVDIAFEDVASEAAGGGEDEPTGTSAHESTAASAGSSGASAQESTETSAS